MKQIVDGKQMKALDERTIQYYGVPPLVLMERASLAVAEEIKNSFNTERILVVCGTAVDETVLNDIAAANRFHVASSTMMGILSVDKRKKKE